jgi:hypothetical protein
MTGNQMRSEERPMGTRGGARRGKRSGGAVRVMMACVALLAWGLLAAGCQTHEKTTTLKVQGPNSERKITVETKEHHPE